MTAPSRQLATVTDRNKVKSLKLEQASVLPPGKVWFCRGRTILRHGDLESLARVMLIPTKADTVVVSTMDFDDVKAWIG